MKHKKLVTNELLRVKLPQRFSYSKSDYANPGLVKKISIVIYLPLKGFPED